jgi:TfoX/Sxy family transcriptional regulator of competence genes
MGRSLELLTEACASLNHTPRRMFGGHGFFALNGGMFAGIVTDDAVIFKLVMGPLRDELIALGGHPWVYDGMKKPTTMKEWIVVPDSFYDDGELLAEWASKAHRAVPAKKVTKKAAPKPKPKAKATKAAPAEKKKGPAKKKRK